MAQKKWKVELSRTEYQSATMIVEAETEEEAIDIANDEAVFQCVDADQSVEMIIEQP